MKKKITFRILVTGLILLMLFTAYAWYRLHDRYPGYTLDLDISAGTPSPLRVGFAALPVTPEVPDVWFDANGDYRFNPKDGDTYEDKNQNGKFDAVWLAGFHNNRPATGVNDDLWARAMYIDDGKTKLAWVSVDAIGLGADDILEVRLKLAAQGFTYTIVSSTHTHQSPDLVGLYGPTQFRSGVDPKYMALVKQQIEAAVLQAQQHARPAAIRFAQDLESAKNLVEDARMPIAFDYGVRVMHATDRETGETIGTLIGWACHPETLVDQNLMISSDFPHFVRESMEKGISRGDTVLHEGVGGITMYVNGAIGGMMTAWSDFPIPDPFSGKQILLPTFEKAQAQGQGVALIALRALDQSTTTITEGSIQLKAKSFDLPLYNPLYRLGALAGLFSRGLSGWWKIRTEVAVWRLGPATFLHQPGELYPEIANGVVGMPQGGDFGLREVMEYPPLRELMPGDFKFLTGLSNDFIGYIIPKSQWDEKPPYTYDNVEAPYGEINSVGPETAPIIYRNLADLLSDMR